MTSLKSSQRASICPAFCASACQNNLSRLVATVQLLGKHLLGFLFFGIFRTQQQMARATEYSHRSLYQISVMGGGSEGPYPTITSNLAAAKIDRKAAEEAASARVR